MTILLPVCCWTCTHHPVLFFLLQNYDFRVKDLTFILPLVSVLFIQLLVFLIRWDNVSQRVFFFCRFFNWSLMNFLEQERWRIKSKGTFYIMLFDNLFLNICYNSCKFSCVRGKNQAIVSAGWPVFTVTVSLSRWKSRPAAALLTAHLVCEVVNVLIPNKVAWWFMPSH